jgi:hypothetical protein
MVKIDMIGVVREHRWATADEQRQSLQDAGCSKIVDLDETPRDWFYTAIRERTIIMAPWAFLLTPRKRVLTGLADFDAFMKHIAKLPRGCVGIIKDLDTGLMADNPGSQKAMLAVVRDQLSRHARGLASGENARRGRKALVLTEMQRAKGEAIWRNVRKFPTWKAVEPELKKQISKRMTRWRAHREWGPRIGAKPNQN